MRRFVFLLVCGTASLVAAQGISFKGLNLNKQKKATADAGTTLPAADAGVMLAIDAGLPPPDLADGDPVIAVPPTLGTRIDVESYRLLHAALKERIGARAVPEELTVTTIEKQKLTAELTMADGQKKLGAALKAELMVTFEVSLTQVVAKLLPRPGATPDATATAPTPKGRKLTPLFARALLADLVKKGHATLEPPAGLDLTGPVAPAEPTLIPLEGGDDLESPSDQLRVSARPSPLKDAWLSVFAGGGTSFRSLDAASSTTVVPGSPSVIGALGFDVKLFPLRLVNSLADSKLAELWVEGQYRLNLARATVDSGGTSTSCPVNDDELMGRVGYRYAFGGMLPHLGVTVGVANERTHFACNAPALDTTYTSTEYHLTVLQPILPGQRLAIELAGGPRLLFSTRALGYSTLAWSAEGWITARPVTIFTLRAGARVTGTRLTTYPEGISVLDLRTFVGLEVGAAL